MTQSRNDYVRLTCALLACAFAAGCSPRITTVPPSAPAPAAAVGAAPGISGVRLSEADIADIAALLRMEDRRMLDSAVVRRAAASANPEVRRRAILAAARTGDAAAADFLRLALMSDGDFVIGAAAAFGLGELGDTTHATVSALRRLLLPLPAAPGRRAAAAEAAHALGKIAVPASYAALSEALQAAAGGQTDASVTAELLLAVWRHSGQPATTGLVMPFMRHPDPHVRFAAAYALMRAGGAAALPAMLAAMGDPSADVRQIAARALRSVVADSAGSRQGAQAALVAALRDSSAHVRINAVRALGAYQDPALVGPIGALLQDPDANVRISAVLALDTLRVGDAPVLLRGAAAGVSNAMALRATALAALMRLAPETAEPLALEWARDTSWLVRLYAVRVMAEAPQRAGPHLRALAGDADARVQAEALGAISGSDTTAAADALYVQALGNPDVIVRSVAIAALGRHTDPAHVSILMDAYDRARSDRENDAALAAVGALERLARSDSAVARSFFFRFQRSPDPVVRAAVRRQLGAGSWGDPRPDSERPIAFYEAVVRALVQPALLGSTPRAVIHSQGGDVTIELAAADAPLTVHNFMTLAQEGYFARGAMRWHRVVPNFVLQDGDPRGDGNGGPGYAIRDEINQLRYHRGAVGMALSGPDTGGSQFFITHSPQPHLDGGYTVFGFVRGGMDVADRVVQDEAIHGIEIIR